MTAEKGNLVKIHFNLKTLDGATVESSHGGEPLALQIGSGSMAEQFDSAVIGMAVGEKRTRIVVDAFGARRDDLKIDIDRSVFPPEMELKTGTKVKMNIQGKETVVELLAVGDEKVTIDANNPFAGKDFIFECELVSIEE